MAPARSVRDAAAALHPALAPAPLRDRAVAATVTTNRVETLRCLAFLRFILTPDTWNNLLPALTEHPLTPVFGQRESGGDLRTALVQQQTAIHEHPGFPGSSFRDQGAPRGVLPPVHGPECADVLGILPIRRPDGPAWHAVTSAQKENRVYAPAVISL